MKLVASMMVGPGEADRYLVPVLESLAEFCDEIRVRMEGFNGGQLRLAGTDKLAPVEILSVHDSTFFKHEGRARQELLEWTLQGNPTHVLAVDADEVVSDGPALRRLVEKQQAQPVWSLLMEEVWALAGDCLCVREDGGWRSHPVPVLWRVPDRMDASWRISDRQLACGREPVPVRRLAAHAAATGESLLHFGWVDASERQARYDRYAVADGGRFHASAHLESILWPPERIVLRGRPWPVSLEPMRPLLEQKVAA